MTPFNKNFERVISELKSLCDTFLIKGIPPEYEGIWVPNNEIRAWAIPRRSGELLKTLVLASKSKVILELGTSFGYSTLWLAFAAKHNDGKVYTIELTKPKIITAKEYFEKAQLSDSVIQIEGLIVDELKKWEEKIDFVFFDADKSNYYSYLKQIEPHLEKGSVIVADNACDYGYLMKDFLEYLSKSPSYQSFTLDIDNGLLIAVKIE